MLILKFWPPYPLFLRNEKKIGLGNPVRGSGISAFLRSSKVLPIDFPSQKNIQSQIFRLFQLLVPDLELRVIKILTLEGCEEFWGMVQGICFGFLQTIWLWVECRGPHPDILGTVGGDGFFLKRELQKTVTETSTIDFFSKKP